MTNEQAYIAFTEILGIALQSGQITKVDSLRNIVETDSIIQMALIGPGHWERSDQQKAPTGTAGNEADPGNRQQPDHQASESGSSGDASN